jgi:hypothetical protein
MKTLFLLSFVLMSVFALGQGNWKLVYENDAEGVAVAGKLDDLIAAVRNGESIKIYFRMGTKDDYVEHTVMGKYFTIMNSKQGSVVTAQIDPIIGQTPDSDAGKITLKENLEWEFIAASNGKHDQLMRNMTTGQIYNHVALKFGVKWLVWAK